jgi:hypothetical protein
MWNSGNEFLQQLILAHVVMSCSSVQSAPVAEPGMAGELAALLQAGPQPFQTAQNHHSLIDLFTNTKYQGMCFILFILTFHVCLLP